MSDSYNLKIADFLSRYRVNKKIDDLFSRGYTLATDSHTNKRVILKLYSIQTPEQHQAVLENLQNFVKLNQIPGISKLISFAIAQNENELMSAFEYDPMTLGEFMQILKSSEINRSERLLTYLEILGEVCRIVRTSIQIGIQLDDINRQTILIRQNNYDSQSLLTRNQKQHYSISFFYDERQKQYTKIEKNILILQNNNKLYWSSQKIQNQVLKNSEYSMQEGEQSIYQLGLMMLDVIYQIEKFMEKIEKGVFNRAQEQLKPDEQVLHSENMMSYYQIFRSDKDKMIVLRNQPLITQRLNYLIGLDEDCFKQLGLLLKNMIVLMSQARPNVEMILLQKAKIIQLVKLHSQKPSSLNSQIIHTNPNKNVNNNRGSFKSLQSISQEPIHSSIGQTIKNIQYSTNNISSNNQININNNINFVPDYDSLKYSDNSLGNNNQIFQITNQTIKKYNHLLDSQNRYNESILINYRPHDLKSATTITSEVINKQGGVNELIQNQDNYSSNSNSHKNQSPVLNNEIKNTISIQQNLKGFIQAGQILKLCKLHHQELVSSLVSAIQQLQQIKKVHSERVLKKQYFDSSFYYGCFDKLTKKKKGLGIYVYTTGDIYFGNWDQNLLINGTYLFKNGESFEGTVKAGKQGFGIYRYTNGNVYRGMWKDDLKNGKGTMTYPNGAKYDGEWLKGKKHGQGMYNYENGTKYIGGFALGKKYGNGIFFFMNGTKIEGFWDNNHLEGLAKIYYQNGDYYEGNFHMSQKSGEGLYRWNSQQQGQVQYKGSFKKDSLDGFAIIKFSNGQIYEGKVKNGKRDGQGIYKYSNGDQFKGQWKNDQKQIGKYVFSTGDHFQGRFKQGQMSFGLMKYLNGQTYQGEFYRGERHGVGAYSNKVGQLVYQGHWQRDQYKGNKKN